MKWLAIWWFTVYMSNGGGGWHSRDIGPFREQAECQRAKNTVPQPRDGGVYAGACYEQQILVQEAR